MITKKHALNQAMLDYLFKNISCLKPAVIPNLTYGEILYPSLVKLLDSVQVNQQDVFLDMGSGIGKAILATFLITPVKTLYGIEWVDQLYQQSVEILSRVPSELLLDKSIIFINGDFLDPEYEKILNQVTIVYSCSTCFSLDLMDAIGKILNRAPRLRAVLSFRAIPTLKKLKFGYFIPVEASWDSAVCHVYV